MIPIRDAFNQIGREHFEGEWNSQEIAFLDDWPSTAALASFSASKRAAFDRFTAVFDYLWKDLEAGRVVAVTTDAHHLQHDVAGNYWRSSAYDGQWRGADKKLEEYLTDRSTSRFIRFPTAKTAGAGPGAPKLATWDDYQQRFNEKCDKDGYPDELNADGWQRLADVQRWLEKLTRRDGKTNRKGEPFDQRDTTIKTKATIFMKEYRGRSRKSER